MKQIKSIGLLLVAVVLILAGVKVYQVINSDPSSQAGFRIAILTPTTHPSLEQIEHGLRSNLPNNYQCTTFNSNGQKTLLMGQIKTALEGGYDLIFAIGGTPTQMACSLGGQKNPELPIVSAAAFEVPKDANATGVIDVYYPEKQVEALMYFKPNAKNVLLIYSPSAKPESEQGTAELISELKKRSINVQELQVFATNEIPAKVSAFKHQVDTIIVLRDNMVVMAIDSIIKICNENGITLVASDLDSGDKGAVLSTGILEQTYGSESAKLVRQILEQKIAAKSLPVIKPAAHHIKINCDNLKRQKLEVAPYLLTLMHEGLVVGGHHG